MAEKKEKRYVSDNAQLMAEWDWEKNFAIGILPDSLTCHSNKKVWWICSKCNNAWVTRINSRSFGTGCPICGIEKRANSQAKTGSAFILELQKINPNIIVREEYVRAKVPLECECAKCGHVWKAAPTNLLRGKGCPSCARVNAANKKRRTNDEFLAIIRSFGNDIKPLEEYKGQTSSIKMLCNVCGYEWSTSTGSIVVGRGCPRCAKNGIYSQDEFVSKLKSINPNIEVISNYVRSAKPIECRCLICGNIWNSKPNHLLSGRGCPLCFHSATSFVEQVILEVFRLILGEDEVCSRDKKTVGKELDILIPSMNLAIEPGSWRWHRDKLKNDQNKRDICKTAGIRLITIYSDYTDKTLPYDTDCICVKETLGFENDHTVLKKLISDLLILSGIRFEITEEQWPEIINKAYLNSRRISTTEFRNKVLQLQSNIAVIGEYTGSWNRISCECKKCGHCWSPVANSLLQGYGCPKCADKEKGLKKRKTPEIFEEELLSINKNIHLLSPYVVSTEKIKCECLKCRHKWEALPGNLLKGKGCPQCAKQKRKKKK